MLKGLARSCPGPCRSPARSGEAAGVILRSHATYKVSSGKLFDVLLFGPPGAPGTAQGGIAPPKRDRKSAGSAALQRGSGLARRPRSFMWRR